MKYDATTNYTIEYKKDGNWTELKSWSRPFYQQDKLDETLNSGNLTLNAKELQNLPPYAKLRIVAEQTDGNIVRIVKSYFVTANEPILQRTFAEQQ